MIRFSLAALLVLGVATAPASATNSLTAVAVASDAPMRFDSESAAHDRCPNDSVVWLNANTGVYHTLSVRRYGRTHRGGYVCKAEADAAGAHKAQGKDRCRKSRSLESTVIRPASSVQNALAARSDATIG